MGPAITNNNQVLFTMWTRQWWNCPKLWNFCYKQKLVFSNPINTSISCLNIINGPCPNIFFLFYLFANLNLSLKKYLKHHYFFDNKLWILLYESNQINIVQTTGILRPEYPSRKIIQLVKILNYSDFFYI